MVLIGARSWVKMRCGMVYMAVNHAVNAPVCPYQRVPGRSFSVPVPERIRARWIHSRENSAGGSLSVSRVVGTVHVLIFHSVLQWSSERLIRSEN